MATQPPTTDASPATGNRRHLGLVSFLSRQDSLRFEDLDFSHPILAGSTMAELREAMDELARKASDDLCVQYSHWMGAADTFAVGSGSETDWMPLVKMRYQQLQHRNQTSGRAAIVWSPADCWLVHYFAAPNLGNHKVYYAVQSPISKDPAQYFILREFQPTVTPRFTFNRVNISTNAERLPPRRPIAAMLNDQLGLLMEANQGTFVTSSDPEYPLLNYIRNNIQ